VKADSRVFLASMGAGALSWVLDALLGAFLFRSGSFLDLLLLAIPPERLTFRLIVLVLFLGVGLAARALFSGHGRLDGEESTRALKQSDARFKELAELLPEPVFETDLEFRITYANRKAMEVFGYSAADVRAGLTGQQMLAAEDRARAEGIVKQLRAGEDPGASEFTAVRKDGSSFPMLFHAGLSGSVSDPSGFRGVVVDITERKRAEEILKESEERFRSIVESSPMGVFLYDLQPDGRLLFAGANPAASGILGVDATRFLGMTIEEAFPPLTDTEIPYRYRRAAAEGLPWHTEQVDYDHDGIKGAFEVSVFQTAPNQVAVMFLDITERKTAEEALRDSEGRFRGVIEQLNDATYILFKGRFDLVNPRFTELTGVTAEEAASPDFQFWDLVAPGSIPVIRKRQEQRARGEEVPGIYEFDIKHKDGHLVQVEASVTEIEYRDGTAILGLLRDITAQKNLKEQLLLAQRMESIGRLSGGVAHDLNNLLTPILGYGDLLLDEFSPEDDRRESLEEIMEAAVRAKGLVRQLLAFGRQQAMEFKALDLNEMVRGFQSLLRRTVREDIDIRFTPSPSDPVIRGDRGQLEQVIMNLVVNAQDAMPDGGSLLIEAGEVELDEDYARTHPGVTPGHYGLLAVTDTGMGMDAATREKIFEPFFTTKERGKGTGLGLATAYGIVKQHEGNIWALSAPGEGTTFKVYLPLADLPAPDPGEKKASTPAPGGTETIMVVEDEAAVRGLAARVLERSGYTVLLAGDGEECLETLRDHAGPLDLLLTDVVMPGMNGRELHEQIRERFPDAKVLYMSGYSRDIITHHGALEEGIPFLQKPFSVEGLSTRVREILGEGPEGPDLSD